MTARARPGLILLLLYGCASRAPPSVSLSAEHPAATHAAPAPAADPVADAVTRWNDAHNRHDADALAAVYAPTVDFYGADLSNAEAVKRKRDALAAAPDYAQSVTEMSLAPVDENGGVFARFKKTTTSAARSKSFFGYLYVIGGRVVAEGDRDPKGEEIATRYTYCYGMKDDALEPNDVRVGVFEVSALEAVLAVRHSRAFAELRSGSRSPTRLLVRDCAHGCAPGDFGTCKEGDVIDFLVVAQAGQTEIAAFTVHPITKKVSRVKLP